MKAPSAYEQARLARLLNDMAMTRWLPSFSPDGDRYAAGWAVRARVGDREVTQAVISRLDRDVAKNYYVLCCRSKRSLLPSRRPRARRAKPRSRAYRPDHPACRRLRAVPTMAAAVRLALNHTAKFHRRRPVAAYPADKSETP